MTKLRVLLVASTVLAAIGMATQSPAQGVSVVTPADNLDATLRADDIRHKIQDTRDAHDRRAKDFWPLDYGVETPFVPEPLQAPFGDAGLGGGSSYPMKPKNVQRN